MMSAFSASVFYNIAVPMETATQCRITESLKMEKMQNWKSPLSRGPSLVCTRNSHRSKWRELCTHGQLSVTCTQLRIRTACRNTANHWPQRSRASPMNILSSERKSAETEQASQVSYRVFFFLFLTLSY